MGVLGNSKKKSRVSEVAEPEEPVSHVDLHSLVDPFLSPSNKVIAEGANNVVIPIILLSLATQTQSRATTLDQVSKHRKLIASDQFDKNKSMMYVVESDNVWTLEELKTRHPHAGQLLHGYLQTPFAEQYGLPKLTILDGQHRFKGYQQALNGVWDDVAAAEPDSVLFKKYWIEVNVRLLKAETPASILVRTSQPPLKRTFRTQPMY
jgi:hypothetical protein